MKSEGTHPVSATATTPLRGASNNRMALLALVVPLLLVLGTGLSSLVRRTWSERNHAPYTAGTEGAAIQNARDLCVRIMGGDVKIVHVSQQTAYSRRRNIDYREWNVICDTNWGRYSLRVNARTSRVYAINPLSDVDEIPGPIKEVSGQMVPAGLGLPLPAEPYAGRGWWKSIKNSRPIAQGALNNYFTALGIQPEKLSAHLLYAEPSVDILDPEDVVWTFTYRIPDAEGVGLIKIAISTSNRRLVNYWNPMDAR